MPFNADRRSEWEVTGRVWRFEQFEFDESSRELRSGDGTVELESKPLEVLYQLLLHAGEVVTKEELLDLVWSGVTVVEGSLATAVSKLRKALGDENRIVLTVPRVGYRLAVPVQCKTVAPPPARDLGFQPGDSVPGRDQWRFVRKLHESASSEVWLAEHPKTRESRVFKFAGDGLRLRGLKREVTLARLLKDSLGERPDFVRALEWNFDTPPYYLESEFCGPNLAEWAESHGGLLAIPLAERMRVILELAQSVAAAHAIGVLHKDLKPANILIAPVAGGDFQVKVADFGSGALIDPARLNALGITNLGFTQTMHGGDELTGTLMYLPPEVLAGQSPTASADVYALGVLLYQLIAGDFRKPLSPGWEADVPDPLIREDIAQAACGDPVRRLPSVALLVERLQTIDTRRTERRELELARERAALAERRLSASRARRPWAIAAAVNRFLADDLLARSDPFQSGKSQETLLDAVKGASPEIDRQFQAEPEIAARLHETIAKALNNRSEYPDARREFARAAALYLRAQGPLSQDAIVVGLQQASMEARTYQQGSLQTARALLAKQAALLPKVTSPREDLPVWLGTARGMIALIANDAKTAAAQFQAAYDSASKLPGFDTLDRLTLKQRAAFAYIRLGDGVTAERLFRELISEFSRASGPESANVLRVRLNLAQAYMVEGKNREAVDEATAVYPLYVARLGESHELTMQLLTTRAQCEGSLGLLDDAIRDDLAIYKIALQKQGPKSFFSVATLSDASLAQCRAGHLKEGEANARKSYEAAVAGFGPHSALAEGTGYTLAACLIRLDRLPEASGLLEHIDSSAVAQLTGDRGWGANVSLAQAEIAYRRKDFATARQLLQQASAVFSKPGAEPYQRHAVEVLAAALGK
jgi:eukaryotic-like serine/threonine-protein kinase